ncbi:hypothetical protein TI04_06535, partial [Achromatium sp. WMS2]
VFWVRVSISQFGGVDAILATIATLGFVTVVAIFFGFTGWLGCYLTPDPKRRLALTIPAAWVLMEWLRGWILTGFPWLALGYSQIDSPLAGYAPILGVYGISWILISNVGWILAIYHNHSYAIITYRAAFGILLALLLWGSGWILRQVEWTSPIGDPFVVSMIQPSIPQASKWESGRLLPILKAQRRLSETAPGNLIIWPETAVPSLYHHVEKWLNVLARELALRDAKLLLGVPVLDPDGKRYYNGAVLVGSQPFTAYYKRHLVPFGEYLPLKVWLDSLLKFLKIPMSSFTAGVPESPDMRIGEHTVGISICYEDAFGAEIRQALPDAAYLINLSNDGWFGDSLAPHQHLEIARMRALEVGRPLLRATNSGISAFIGANGQLQHTSKLFVETVLSGSVQPMTGVTPFVFWGDNAILILICLILSLEVVKPKDQTHPN